MTVVYLPTFCLMTTYCLSTEPLSAAAFPRQIATALFGMTAWRHEHHHLPTRQLARIRQ